jgi:hypothetical protein
MVMVSRGDTRRRKLSNPRWGRDWAWAFDWAERAPEAAQKQRRKRREVLAMVAVSIDAGERRL